MSLFSPRQYFSTSYTVSSERPARQTQNFWVPAHTQTGAVSLVTKYETQNVISSLEIALTYNPACLFFQQF